MSDFGSVAKAATCGNCRAPIWKLSTGSGFNVKLDTQPLSLPLETLARLAGRTTFECRPWASTFIAEVRLVHEMTTPAIVLTQHKCEHPTTSPQVHPDYWNRKPYASANPDTCPF